jgi:acyl carrier protein
MPLEHHEAEFRAQLAQKIQSYSSAPIPELAAADKLFSTGIIDSLTIVEIIEFIEDYWQIRVEPSDLSIDNFDSITAIENYVRGKLAG